jgi:hypothetical protein
MKSDTAVEAPSGAPDTESVVVHAWRVSQLTRLGVAWPVAEAVADKIDWHEVATLVRLGCPASLAVTIVQ